MSSPTGRISVAFNIRDDLSRKSKCSEYRTKVSDILHKNLREFNCFRWLKFAITSFSSYEIVLGSQAHRGGIKITRNRYNITLHVYCATTLRYMYIALQHYVTCILRYNITLSVYCATTLRYLYIAYLVLYNVNEFRSWRGFILDLIFFSYCT